MRIKDGFVTREVMGMTVAVPVGERAEQFRGMVKLNDSGALIWDAIARGLTEEEIARELVDTYSQVDYEKALQDTRKVIGQLKEAGIVEI